MTAVVCPHCQGLFSLRPNAALTRRQLECLAFIRTYMMSQGVAPAFEDIKRGLSLNSKAGVYRLINGLEERGAIVRMHERARSLEITEAGVRSLDAARKAAA